MSCSAHTESSDDRFDDTSNEFDSLDKLSDDTSNELQDEFDSFDKLLEESRESDRIITELQEQLYIRSQEPKKIILASFCNVIFKSEKTRRPDDLIKEIYDRMIRTLLSTMSIRDIQLHCVITASTMIKPLIDRFGNHHVIHINQQKELWNEEYYENNKTVFELIIVMDRLPEAYKKAKLESDAIRIQICDYVGKQKKIHKCYLCRNYAPKKSVCGLRYCSDECQKFDWKHHKQICELCRNENKRLKEII